MSDEELEARIALRDARGRLWRGGVAKFFADGVIDAGTAWLEEPDTHGEGTAPFWPEPERMAQRDGALRRAPASSSRRTRSATPRCASRSAPTCARARRPACATGSSTWRRCPDDLVAAIAAAGVTASMQPVHLAALRGDGTGNWNERLGPERAARAFRMRDLLDAGAVLALGSDWPVADADPRARPGRRAAAAAAARAETRSCRTRR